MEPAEENEARRQLEIQKFQTFYLQRNSAHDEFRPDIDYYSGLAANSIALVINSLVLINAGALVALATIFAARKDFIPGDTLVQVASAFVVGLILAIITGAFQIWNARLRAAWYRVSMNATLVGMAHTYYPGPDIAESIQKTTAPDLAGLPNVDRRAKLTAYCAWATGAVSLAAFGLGCFCLLSSANPSNPPAKPPVLTSPVPKQP